MALKGTLEDMPVIDLIQFAHQSRRTGALVISDGLDEARLYYIKGKLVRAESGQRLGQETLVQVVDWSKGEFEFLPGVEASEPNIETDLHRSVMNALKVRDERREQARTAEETPEPVVAGEAPRPEPEPAGSGREVLSRFVTGAIAYAALAPAEGGVWTEACASGSTADRFAGSCEILVNVCRQHGGGLRRVFLEEDGGLLCAAPAPGRRWVILAAEGSSSLGAISIAMMKVLSALAEQEQALPGQAG